MKIFDKIKNVKCKVGTFCHNNRSDIYIGAGILSVIGGVITACIAARKVDDILDEHEYEIEEVHAINNDENSEMTKSEYNREVAKVYGKTVWSFTKAFTPCVTLTTTGIFFILKGHKADKEDKQSLIAAYNGVWAGFNAYRDRVREKFGEEEERKLYYGVREEEKEVEVEGKDGKKRKKKEKIDVYPENASPYALIFDKFNVNFLDEEREGAWAMNANFMFLEGIEETATNRLLIKGQLTLNEVHKLLGYPESRDGNVVGWRTIENGGKDGYVSFGIKNRNACVVLTDGHSEGILINPNVDGVIIDDKFDKISGIEVNRPW